jgi:hypothetical protein
VCLNDPWKRQAGWPVEEAVWLAAVPCRAPPLSGFRVNISTSGFQIAGHRFASAVITLHPGSLITPLIPSTMTSTVVQSVLDIELTPHDRQLTDHLDSVLRGLTDVQGSIDCTDDNQAVQLTHGTADWTRHSQQHIQLRLDSHQALQFWCEVHFAAHSRDEVVPRKPFACNTGRLTNRGLQKLMCQVDTDGVVTIWDSSLGTTAESATACVVTTRVPKELPELGSSTLDELQDSAIEEFEQRA